MLLTVLRVGSRPTNRFPRQPTRGNEIHAESVDVQTSCPASAGAVCRCFFFTPEFARNLAFFVSNLLPVANLPAVEMVSSIQDPSVYPQVFQVPGAFSVCLALLGDSNQ